jgi:hypothetical protein
MQHAHARRKENVMNELTPEQLRIRPETLALLEARARRARSEAVASLAGRLVRAVAGRVAPRLDARHCAPRAS